MPPRAMDEFVLRAVEAFGLERPHVVGPDIATAASLFAAASHPGRLRSLVIGTGGAAVPLQLGPPLSDWVEDHVPSIDGREVVKIALGTLKDYVPSDTAREDHLAAYAGERFAQSTAYVQKYPQELPVLIVNGRNDPVVPPVNAEFLRDRLPNAKLVLMETGHFLWEEAAADYAVFVTGWWTLHA